jgi:DNA-binding response OmpR family regulator
VLRIQSVLRRAAAPPQANGARLRDGDLEVDPGRRVAWRNGQDLHLTSREFDLLVHFLTHLWDWQFGDKSTVTVHVRRLREKVEADPASPRRLLTVWGVGYRWAAA